MEPRGPHGGEWQGRTDRERLFRLDPPAGAGLGWLAAPVAPLLERVLALDELNRFYDRVSAGPAESFLDRALTELGVSCRVSESDLARVPARGPLLVVANHPFGAIEGIVLAVLLRRVRPDVRIMVNFLLSRIPELRELFICVDPFGGGRSAEHNHRPMRQALRWLAGGGALAVFPAGEVAHLKLGRGVIEPPWNNSIARLIRRSGAAALPVYFDGQNGPLFQALGIVHPRLRTALLPRQLLNKGGATLDVRIGAVIPSARLARIGDDAQMAEHLRQRVLLLRHRCMHGGTESSSATHAAPATVPSAVDSLQSEIDRLPPEQLMVDGGQFRVYLVQADQIPGVLQEIGRLREITYRASGEGTGKETDLDPFDAWYRHLFLWDAQQRQVVGAYRIGPSDEILAHRGPGGLYTSTLFAFKPRLLSRISRALELGRAFVRGEQQRSFAPLMLLWKGIARFVCVNQKYKILFGPVSISNDYQSFSRELLVRFIRSYHLAGELADLAPPRKPFAFAPERWRGIDVGRLLPNGEEVDALVSDLEPDGKGMPVLLRQYLKLGARFLSFNVDEGFGSAIDALMFVDLTQTDRRVLERYMGRPQTAQFLAHHAAGSSGTESDPTPN